MDLHIFLMKKVSTAQYPDDYKFKWKKTFISQRYELYKSYLGYCLNDEKIEQHEVDVLKHLKGILQLNQRGIETLFTSKVKSFLADEEQEMYEIAKSLGIDITINDKSKREFEKYKLYWQTENGVIPTIESELIYKNLKNFIIRLFLIG